MTAVRLDLKQALETLAQSRESLDKIVQLLGFKNRNGESARSPSPDAAVSVLCPFHDDHDPSGRLRFNELGEVTFECWGSCDISGLTATSLFRLRELGHDLPAPNLPALLYWQWKYRMLLRADVLDVDLLAPHLPFDDPRFQVWRHRGLRHSEEKVKRLYRGIFELMQIKYARFGNPATMVSGDFLVEWTGLSKNEALAIRTKLIEVGTFKVSGEDFRHGRPTPILVPGNYVESAKQENPMPVLLQATPEPDKPRYDPATDPFLRPENIAMHRRQMRQLRTGGIKLSKVTVASKVSANPEKIERREDGTWYRNGVRIG